ncbi:MAG: T9SS type A sorting domain-containing protein [Bacteroidota bacterium]
MKAIIPLIIGVALNASAAAQGTMPIYVTGMVHIDPLNTNTTDSNVVIANYNSHRNAFLWYVRYADSVGLGLSAQMTGVYAEACVRRSNASDFASFMPGGVHHLGMHAHITVKRPTPYLWRTVNAVFGNNRDTVRQVMEDNIPWVNAVFTGNGYTSAANWFFHGSQASYPGMDTVLFRYPVPNPFPYDNIWKMCGAERGGIWIYKAGFMTEPRQSPDTAYIKIPEVGGIIGYDQVHGPEGMVYGTVPYQRRDFLRVYIEWRESVRRGEPSAVRYFNWMIHPYQLVPGAVGTDGRLPRVHIQELVTWLKQNFVGQRDETGNIVGQFANVAQIRSAYESWRQTNPSWHEQLQNMLASGQRPLYLRGIFGRLERTYHETRLTITDTNLVIHRMMDTVSRQPLYLTWSRSGNRLLEPALTGWFRIIRGDSSTSNLHSSAITIGLEPVLLLPSSPSGVNESDRPTMFSLEQNYPNPFNATTTIRFRIGDFGFRNPGQAAILNPQSKILLKVYDVLGREVATLVNEGMKPGSYEVTWDATGMASGVYFYRLRTEGFIQSKKLLLLR